MPLNLRMKIIKINQYNGHLIQWHSASFYGIQVQRSNTQMFSIFSVHISNIREPSHAYFLSKSEALWLQSIGIGNCRLAMLETKYFTIIFTSSYNISLCTNQDKSKGKKKKNCLHCCYYLNKYTCFNKLSPKSNYAQQPYYIPLDIGIFFKKQRFDFEKNLTLFTYSNGK